MSDKETKKSQETLMLDLVQVVESFSQLVVKVTDKTVEFAREYVDSFYRCENSRCLYLSKHAKKNRVRKKNAHRLMRIVRG